MFISVDLPAPFSPSSACTSPLAQVEVDVVVREDAREALRDAAQLEDGRVGGGGHSRGDSTEERRGRARAARPLRGAISVLLDLRRRLDLAGDDLRAERATFFRTEAGTFGLILPRPTPPFFRLKVRSLPPLNWPFCAPLMAR